MDYSDLLQYFYTMLFPLWNEMQNYTMNEQHKMFPEGL